MIYRFNAYLVFSLLGKEHCCAGIVFPNLVFSRPWLQLMGVVVENI